jgi:hypothetical protein
MILTDGALYESRTLKANQHSILSVAYGKALPEKGLAILCWQLKIR